MEPGSSPLLTYFVGIWHTEIIRVMERVKKRIEKERKFNRRLDEIVRSIQTS